MKAFEYAAPRTEADVVRLLSDRFDENEVLAGGTDLIGLMKAMIVTPQRVVNIKEVDSLVGIQADSTHVVIGAATTLDDVLEHPAMEAFPAITQAIRGISSMQLQAQGTFGGELCQRPRCWYFRNGHGRMPDGGQRVASGQNRYHAILGNEGPAKYVHPSRIAPALISLGAQVRIVGPGETDEMTLPVEALFRTPRNESQRETILEANQLLAQIMIPTDSPRTNATYEVRHGAGPEYPLTSAAASLDLVGGVVQDAAIVLGHVAPVPWVSIEAADKLIGRRIDHTTAEWAGRAAVAQATPLSDNHYKVQLAQVAVKRAVLMAAGIETGGF